MRIGFDLDGTLSNNPSIAHLARSWGRDGHKVIIITASDAGKEAIKAQLYSLNIEWYHKLVMVTGNTDDEIGQAKGKAANKYRVSVYFDNNAAVLAGFSKTSRIARVQVLDQDDDVNTSDPKRELTPWETGLLTREIDASCTGPEDAYQCPLHGEVHGADWNYRTRYDGNEED